MKKLLSLILVLVLLSTILVGCTTKTTAPAPAETPAPAKTPAPAETPVVEGGQVAKLGLGQSISIAKSKDAGVDANGKEVLAQAEVSVTMAAAGFDADGKVVSVTLDVAQTKIAFDKDLKVTSDKTAEVKTKKDLGPDYGMIAASVIKKEWFEQAGALEEWMIGKTIEEIKGMKITEGLADVPELTSSVTIKVADYIAAVDEAWTNAVDATGAETVGLGVETHIDSSKDKGVDDAGKEVLPVGQADTYMTATAFDKDGKVVATIIDNAQVKVAFDAEGKVTADKEAAPKTKVELGADYGMAKASVIKKEWFEQMGALQDWMAGKTLDEITGLKVKETNPTHQNVPDVAELTSSVTITVESYIAVVNEAAANAK